MGPGAPPPTPYTRSCRPLRSNRRGGGHVSPVFFLAKWYHVDDIIGKSIREVPVKQYSPTTITLPLYELKMVMQEDGGEKRRVSYHEPIDEEITILLGQIFEVNFKHQAGEYRRSREGAPVETLPEVIVRIKTINDTYMVFAEQTTDDTLNEVAARAQDLVRRIAEAIAAAQSRSNPFQELSNLLVEKFSNLSDTI